MLRYIDYKKVFIISLTLIFLFMLLCPSLFAVFGVEESKMLEELEKGPQQEIPTQDIEIFKRPYLEYNAYNLKDPFEDFLARKTEELNKEAEAEMEVTVTPPPLIVQGIVWGGVRPQAIINDRVVKKGDVIEEAEIIEISKNGVTVLYKKRIYKLSSPASNYMDVSKQEVTK